MSGHAQIKLSDVPDERLFVAHVDDRNRLYTFIKLGGKIHIVCYRRKLHYEPFPLDGHTIEDISLERNGRDIRPEDAPSCLEIFELFPNTRF